MSLQKHVKPAYSGKKSVTWLRLTTRCVCVFISNNMFSTITPSHPSLLNVFAFESKTCFVFFM